MNGTVPFDEALAALQAAIHRLGGRLTAADHGALVAALADVERTGADLAAASQPAKLSEEQTRAAADTRESLDRMMQAVRLMSARSERRLRTLRPDGCVSSYTKTGAAAGMPRARTRTTA